jgi:hypothetical protein
MKEFHLLVFVLALLVACSDSPEEEVAPASDTGGEGDTAQGDTAQGDTAQGDTGGEDDAPEGDAGTGPDSPGADTGEDTSGDAAPDGEMDASEAVVCRMDAECGDNAEFCRRPRGTCEDPNSEGTCETRPSACSGVWNPVCGCDNTTYQNECAAWQVGVNSRHAGPCQGDPIACDGPGADCPEAYACECSEASCGEGICMRTPLACGDEDDPVCGCDGETYSNDCERRSAGACLSADGECPPRTCGGLRDLQCSRGDFCDRDQGECGNRLSDGICVEVVDCTDLAQQPVCGCDGVTYGSDCLRIAAGVQKNLDGACPSADCESNRTCTPGTFCEFNGCSQRLGECAAIPRSCSGLREVPECGCDGDTYANACERRQAGVSKAADGVCVDVCSDRIQCRENGAYCERDVCADPRSSGVCTDTPTRCPRPVRGQEVCGCNGETYGSDCLRRQARVSLLGQGECAICGPRIFCRAGFCETQLGQCAQLGLCAPQPESCPDYNDPVCGCNGISYQNDCARQMAGAALRNNGACR